MGDPGQYDYQSMPRKLIEAHISGSRCHVEHKIRFKSNQAQNEQQIADRLTIHSTELYGIHTVRKWNVFFAACTQYGLRCSAP
jgi:hypothetical protein